MSPVIKRLDASYDHNKLYDFLITHGATPHNFIPEGPVREHLSGLSDGSTLVWAATDKDRLVGFVTAKAGSQFSVKAEGKEDSYEIGEFVVSPDQRGKGTGCKMAQAAINDVFALPNVNYFHVMVHGDNIGSRKAFLKAGFQEIMTYWDGGRNRRTTALRVDRPDDRYPVIVKKLDGTFDTEVLAKFVLQYGNNRLNWIPEPQFVEKHVAGLRSGSILCFGAFEGKEMIGLLTAKFGSQFKMQAEGPEIAYEVGEFVVKPGASESTWKRLAAAAMRDVFLHPGVEYFHAMVHCEAHEKRHAFKQVGFREVMTFVDGMRKRRTTVMQATRVTDMQRSKL